MTTVFPRDKRAHDAWATDFERRAIGSHRITGDGPICAHNFVTDAVRRDPTLDSAVVQAEGAARCIAAQLAALEEK
jgi:hypothetical protein